MVWIITRTELTMMVITIFVLTVSSIGSGHQTAVCDVIDDKELRAAQTVWNYMLLNHAVRKCDVILALGSYDVRVARKAADLWLEGKGDWLVMSGGTGNLTQKLWNVPEAHIFRDVAVGRGVARDSILMETESTNSGQNVRFTHALLSSLAITPSSVLLVQKPYMQRRAYTTFLAQWPSLPHRSTPDVIVTSPDITLTDYPNNDVGSLSDVISVMLGDMQRIFLYGKLGFQIKQEVPADVERAFDFLACTGRYNGYMQ